MAYGTPSTVHLNSVSVGRDYNMNMRLCHAQQCNSIFSTLGGIDGYFVLVTFPENQQNPLIQSPGPGIQKGGNGKSGPRAVTSSDLLEVRNRTKKPCAIPGEGLLSDSENGRWITSGTRRGDGLHLFSSGLLKYHRHRLPHRALFLILIFKN